MYNAMYQISYFIAKYVAFHGSVFSFMLHFMIIPTLMCEAGITDSTVKAIHAGSG